MNKKKNAELSQMFKFAGNRHWLTIVGCVLAEISTVLSMGPFVCIWLRKIIDDNAGLTEGFLAHQLPDLTGAVVMPIAVIILLFVFDWRLGICCMVPLVISVFFLKKMMGGENANFMSGYMSALENMNKEAVEFVRGIPVVKVFQQTVYSFKNFRTAIEEYKKYASGYAICCRIPLTGFNVTLNGTFILLIPVAMMILAGTSGQADIQKLFFDFLFYSLFTPICTTMMNRIMFASEQLMAAKSAVRRIEAVLQEKTLEEAKAQEAISKLVRGKTVLVIAHRMRTIEAADQIIVLDQGVVAESGNHDTLMKKHGLYRKLVDLQTESANWKI